MKRLLLLVLGVLAFSGGGIAAAVALHGDDARQALEGLAGGARDRVTAPIGGARETTERVTGRDVPAVSCPSDAEAGCVAVRGRVVFVESVDPDGDGDLHVVLADGSITGPGVTSVDVRPGLRPERDPRIGEVVSAAGPVQRGSFGQRQVHALRFRAS